MARRTRGWTENNGAAYGYEPRAVRRSSKLTKVAEVKSRRDPSRKWTVKRNEETKVLSCDCPSWIFRPQCSDCGEPLTHAGGGVLRCDRGHGTVGLPGGPTRSCKHIRAYLEDERQKRAVDPRFVAFIAQMKESATIAKVRDLLFERQWEELGKALFPRLDKLALGASAGALEPATDLVLGGVRVIELED